MTAREQDDRQRTRLIAGRYVIQSVLGRGRYATVHLATDMRTGTLVALKVLSSDATNDAVARERFCREAELIRQVSHPNIVKIFDLVIEPAPRQSLIVMEYLSGQDAKNWVRRHGPMPLDVFLGVAREIVDTVRACHERGIVHRDIKPHNVVITDTGGIKILDFGVSRLVARSDLTRTGSAIGSPEYMAPELFARQSVDQRADIYGIGATFYEMLAGRPPFHGTNLAEVFAMHLRGERPDLAHLRADLPEWLVHVVDRCLFVDPNDRYQSCAELQADIALMDKAWALLVTRATTAHCPRCRMPLLSGLDFCHSCGRELAASLRPGPLSIALHQCEDVPGLYEHLAAAHGKALNRAMLKPLRRGKFPLLLVTGVDHASVEVVIRDISAFYPDCEIIKSTVRSFRLPARTLFAAMAMQIAVLLAAGNLPTIKGAAGILVVISLLVILPVSLVWHSYHRKTRALLWRPRNKTSGALAVDAELPLQVWLAKELAAIGSRDLRALVAKVAASAVRLRRRRAPGQGPDLRGHILEVAQRAVTLGQNLSRIEAYLVTTSASEIDSRVLAVEAKLSVTEDRQRTTELIDAKVSLMRSRATYEELQERYQRLKVLLLKAQTLMKSLETTSIAFPPAGTIGDFEKTLRELRDSADLSDEFSPDAAA